MSIGGTALAASLPYCALASSFVQSSLTLQISHTAGYDNYLKSLFIFLGPLSIHNAIGTRGASIIDPSCWRRRQDMSRQ